jgi:hypothetical protein
MSGPVETRVQGFERLAARLAASAGTLAHAAAARRIRTADDRWRMSGLVWPLFGKE